MSRSTTVDFDDRFIWVFDEARAIWMKYVIDAVMRRGASSWMTDELQSWRVTASVGDYSWIIDQKGRLTPDETREFLEVAQDACETLAAERPLSLAEVTTWSLVDELQPVERFGLWDDPIDTKPIVELGRAVMELVSGALPDPPVGRMWFFGWRGGRTTIAGRVPED